MHPILKCLLVLLGAGALAVVATFVALFGAGPSVAAGERAVVAVGVFDLLLFVATCAGLVWATTGMSPWPRWLGVGGGAAAFLAFLLGWMVMTVIMFNR